MIYKVMLVDDEMLVRLGVKSLIQWEEHGFEFMGYASDGSKALELMVADGPPDILLTDIVMPNMNGLELIEKVKERYPSTLIIVLSSHNEFDYVRKAMKLGVEDYLLKTSLKPSELLKLLVEASVKVQRNQENHIEKEKSGAAGDIEQNSGNRLLQLAMSTKAESFPEAVDPLPENSYILLLYVRGIREGVPKHSIAQLIKHLVEAELQGILHAGPVQTDKVGLAAILSLQDGDRVKLKSRIDHLAYASRSLLGITLSGYTNGPIYHWQEVVEQIAELKKSAMEREDSSLSKEALRADIKKLLGYMEEHYAESLSLRTAAGMINMSEAYLSTLFKKETGSTFTDWLNVLRIQKASSFLIETDWPSYIISEKVGYENTNYFGRIFKKIKGVSPQKYRALYGSKSSHIERM
ncbi:response regulator transcription factor [Paenibacillus agaridevorans]|uniref:response regulator transcription factor n=1 Tax=Paenibacillus agaridevorans TaxID=171404 RepID=UPI001BE3FAAB|nr:response regulator [Paenibacillus agaridevorans]